MIRRWSSDEQVFGWLVPCNWTILEPEPVRDLCHLARPADRRTRRRPTPMRGSAAMIAAASAGSHVPRRAGMEIEPDPVGARSAQADGFIDARQAADLDADHGMRHARGLGRRTAQKDQPSRTRRAVTGGTASEPGSGDTELVAALP